MAQNGSATQLRHMDGYLRSHRDGVLPVESRRPGKVPTPSKWWSPRPDARSQASEADLTEELLIQIKPQDHSIFYSGMQREGRHKGGVLILVQNGIAASD